MVMVKLRCRFAPPFRLLALSPVSVLKVSNASSASPPERPFRNRRTGQGLQFSGWEFSAGFGGIREQLLVSFNHVPEFGNREARDGVPVLEIAVSGCPLVEMANCIACAPISGRNPTLSYYGIIDRHAIKSNTKMQVNCPESNLLYGVDASFNSPGDH
jgi:hypothetical protein